MNRVGQNHTLIGIYGVHTVFLAGKSPYIRSYTVQIYNYGQPYLSVISGQNHTCIQYIYGVVAGISSSIRSYASYMFGAGWFYLLDSSNYSLSVWLSAVDKSHNLLKNEVALNNCGGNTCGTSCQA